jgi:hypothetical protein
MLQQEFVDSDIPFREIFNPLPQEDVNIQVFVLERPPKLEGDQMVSKLLLQ